MIASKEISVLIVCVKGTDMVKNQTKWFKKETEVINTKAIQLTKRVTEQSLFYKMNYGGLVCV